MIRAIVSGAASPAGGELVRLLLHHPDVELTVACQPAHATMALSSVVPGFIGDTSLRIAETYGPADGDVLFLADSSVPDFDIDGPEAADLRIVDLTGILEGHEGFVTGVCELNRKPLVRGAKRAVVPDALTLLAVTSLLPLMKGSLHEGEIVAIAEGIGPEHAVAAAGRASQIMRYAQLGYNGRLKISTAESGESEVRDLSGRVRFMRFMAYGIPVNADLKHVQEMYDEYFDDHNFVFTLPGRKPHPIDVVNTNKLLINLEKSPADGTLTVTAAFDPVLKGSAGAAVHCMNLLFGLHERTGLDLLALG